MSITIHNGFAVDAARGTLPALHALITEFREEIKVVAEEYLLARFLKDAISELDHRTLGLPRTDKDKDRSPLSCAWNRMLEAKRDGDRGYRRPGYDVSLSLMLFPLADGRVLGMPFTERQEWVDLWLQKNGVTPYGYWDNSDPDEDISPEAWQARTEDWHAALIDRNSGIPSLNGFQATIHGEGNPPMPDKLTPEALQRLAPSLKARAAAIAQATVVKPTEAGEITPSDFLKQFFEAQDDGRFAAETDRIMALLIADPDYTILKKAA
jgi:hypothetical protein